MLVVWVLSLQPIHYPVVVYVYVAEGVLVTPGCLILMEGELVAQEEQQRRHPLVIELCASVGFVAVGSEVGDCDEIGTFLSFRNVFRILYVFVPLCYRGCSGCQRLL